MPKRCPKCKTLNSGSALRCANPDCDHLFSAVAPSNTSDPSAIPSIPPAIAAEPEAEVPVLQLDPRATGQPPVLPAAAAPPPVSGVLPNATPNPEVEELRSVVDRLHKQVADQQEQLQRLAEQESRALPAPTPAPTTPAPTARAIELRDLIARTTAEAAQQGWRRLSAWRNKSGK
jgi:hypothetical protein